MRSVNYIVVERTTDLDMSGYRCAKLDPRYPTRLSVEVMMSGFTVYSIFNVPFCSVSKMTLWRAICKYYCPIDRLATNRHLSQKKLEI